ncbi:hypothetical protein GTV32_21550 [Gordonia sp. SID5947]|uniref:hypothetical protein n=1 Tax=Gordonia sp. SID5947 TaxID=2690315 RepID=UPI001368EF90|nr:hypothetical protein [Gordonia sp. SID5947]MYR08736.1 hypothetical protein [Gordonia sp. SID5947]
MTAGHAQVASADPVDGVRDAGDEDEFHHDAAKRGVARPRGVTHPRPPAHHRHLAGDPGRSDPAPREG